MKFKTFILTFLMMMSCSILFGQGESTGLAKTESKFKQFLFNYDYGTITIGDDFSVSSTIEIPKGRKITIDLNGHKLTTNEDIYIFKNFGQLTITDNSTDGKGTISSLGIYNGKPQTRTNTDDIDYTAQLTIKGGVFENISKDGGAAIYNHLGVIDIQGGEFYGKYSAITNFGLATIANAYIECLNRDNGAAAIFNDFEIEYGNNVNVVGRYYTADSETASITDGKATYLFAELNGVKYPSLQAALDKCATGNNTINLLFHNSDNATVSQKEGVNITIDGNGYKGKQFEYTGTICVHGNSRNTGTETLTIQDINFITENDSHDFILCDFRKCNEAAETVVRYAHNVTVQNCNFNAKEESTAVVALRFRQSYNINVKDSEFKNLHSAMWATGTSGIAFDNITATKCKEGGISVATSTPVSVKNSIIEGAQYGVRADGSGNYSLNIEGGKLTAAAPVIVRNTTAEYNLTVNNNVELDATENGPQVVVTAKGDSDPYVVPTSNVKVTLYNNVTSTFGLTAKIGNAFYATLQDAVDKAKTGETVTLIADNCKEDVTVNQAPNYAITIDGAEKTFKGTITVDGKSKRYETTALTIIDVNFDATEGISADACINLGAEGNNDTRYTNKVTVESCTFTDNDYSSVAVKSYTGGDHNLVVMGCEANGMHSLAQLKNIEQGLVISGNIANTKNGINLNQTAVGTIVGNEINVKGYAVRIGESTGGNITLNENTLKTDNTEGDPVIELRGTVVALNMEKNVVSGNTHIKGTAGTISVDANYWDGKEAPVVAEGSTPIIVNSYYKDEALTNLVRIPMGSDFTAYTREDAIWGEVGGNAVESFVIKVLDAEDNVMGTTVLNNVGGIIDGSVYVTWSLKLDAESNQDEYWTMQWTTAPSIDNMPAKVELWVDGVKVSGGDVVLNAPDNLSKINAANIDADGKILAYRTNLTEAVNNGDNVAILTAGTHNLPTGKNLTITGAVDGVQFGPIGTPNMGMKNYTFNNVTFNYAADSHYKGLQHAGDMVYNNCTFNGQVFLYGESETFNNCTFKQEDSNNYNVWTYGAKEVAFNGCTFNSAGKSVLIYKEKTPGFVANISVDKCEFNATTAVEGKAAIEMDSSLIDGINLTIDSEDTPEEDRTTATGFGFGNASGNSLWNNKKGNDVDANNDITVIVAGETVLEPVYVAKIGEEGHRTLQEAINASQDNDEIVLLDNVTDVDATISKKVTLNLNEKTITDAYIIITSEVNIKGGSIKNVNEPYPLVVKNGGKLTVDGVGIEASKSDRAIWVREGSELVFNNSSILATKGEGNNKTNLIAAIYTDSNTDVTINSGTITVDTPDNKAVAIFGNYKNANVTVNGGKISTSGKNYSYGINVDGDITVTGGEIVTNEKGYAYSSGIRYGYNYALVTATGNVTITGGSITTNGFSGYAVNVGRSYSSNDQTVSITGGTFTNNLSEVEMTTGGHNAPVLVWTGTASTVTATIENGNFSGYNANLFRKDNEEDNSTLEVSGGTFDREINGEYLAKGYAITANENGTYGVSLASYVVLPEGVTAENYKEKFGDNTVTDGTNYYATMTAALNAVYGTETTLYCKPGANVGQMTHGAIKETLTVYGNDAYTSGNGDFDIGNCNYEGKEITSDITLTVKHLDGCGAWGYKNTEHTINIVFENCKDMSEVYLSGTAGRTNITMTNCEFTDNVDGGNCKVYSNADGTITLKDMLFSGVDKAVNFNHKATGTQTIALENCTFTNCGDDVAGDEIPVRVLSSVAGGNSVLTVTDCTFTGTPEGGADILLDYGVGLTEATVSNTAAKVVVEKENNVGETTIVAANETKSFVNLVPVAKIGDAVYYTFEDAIAAAVTDASITSIEILRDYTQTYYIEAGKTYSILENQNLTVVAPEGKSYTITLDRTIGKTFSIYQKSANSSLTIADNVTIEGLEILANGFATSGNNTNINGTLKAMSLKQWTSDGTITVSETGKVWLGYGDGQFDLAYDNGAVVINGNGDKTEAQFKAGYSGTRGNGNTLTLNDTYFEAGAWFNLNGSNGTININNSLLKVSGGDAAGKMTIKAGNVVYVNEGGTLECANITLEEGAKIVVNGGTLKAKTVTNNGEIAVLGESTLNIETHTGENIDFLDGAIVNNSTVGGEAFVAGNVTFRGANTFVMLYDYGTLTDYYGTTAPMKWNVEKGASVTLTNKARYGLGYGDEVTVIGNIENALTARENLSDDDRSLFMHGLVAQESSGWNCNSKLIVENAYVVLGSNNSFGNKPGNYGGNYTINFKNSVVDASRITFYEALSTTTFTFEGSDVKMGTFMTRDADSKFTLKDSKVLSTTTTNGTDEGNYNAGELVLENSSLTYSAAVINTGTIEIGAASTLTAPAVTNEGTINFTALDSKLVTATEGLTIKLDEAYPDHKVVYKDVAYVVVEKVYVAKIGEQGYESLAEALDAVENGETIELLGTEGSEISKEIDFTEDIEFTITGNAPNYGLPIVTFQNATVNIKDATILIPELDARQDATINVINSTVYDAGGNSIAKSYYNGAINISGTSEVYMMQVTTMGYINISGTAKLHATWQTNVYGNGLITLNEGATFNTAALQLTAKDYSGRDNTDADRVGQPAEIVVNGATLNVGKVQSSNGADYSYHSSYGINVGTIEGKSAILNIINGGTVNYFMKDGETANIGAGGTVNVNASTFNVACRAENGTVTLANAGTINVENATVEIAKLDNDNLLFISGENTFKVEDATGSSYALRAKDGVVFNNSYVKGTANETIRLLGSATFNGGFECAYLQGQKVIEDNPLNGGIGGTIAIEEGTTVHATYGVEISNDYTLNGGNIELSGGNADGDLWGFVFQNSECTINSNIKVVGNTGTYAPIHFTNVTATVNGNISQSNSGGEVIYIKNSEVTFAENSNVTTTTGVHVNDGSTLTNRGEINGNVTVNSTLLSENNITGTIVKAATATIQLTGGIYTTEPEDSWCAENYDAFPYDENSWVVRQISGEQTFNLVAGWNWVSSYITEFKEETGLAMLQIGLGTNGIQIKNDNYTSNYRNGSWGGGLKSVSVEEMYKVNMSDDVNFKFEGSFVNYDECEIVLRPGWNYIGYPVNVETNLADALVILSADGQEESNGAKVGDVIKSQLGSATYIGSSTWLFTNSFNLVPGEGYMYYNSSDEVKILRYTTKKATTTSEANTRSSKHWIVDATQYPSNMTMIAMTDVEGGNYEVAAFVKGEVRGSSRPVYVESLDAYILILTISGDDVEEMTFKCYDLTTDEEVEFSNRINYSNDAIVGSIYEPYMLTRGTTGIGEAAMSNVNIYPNPTTTGTEINLEATCDKVEVFNALGVKVVEYQNVDSIDALETAGIYVIRITNNGNVQNCRLVVK